MPLGGSMPMPFLTILAPHNVVDNLTLMRLRELEVLEWVATSSKLNVVLGEKSLAERVVNLL